MLSIYDYILILYINIISFYVFIYLLYLIVSWTLLYLFHFFKWHWFIVKFNTWGISFIITILFGHWRVTQLDLLFAFDLRFSVRFIKHFLFIFGFRGPILKFFQLFVHISVVLALLFLDHRIRSHCFNIYVGISFS